MTAPKNLLLGLATLLLCTTSLRADPPPPLVNNTLVQINNADICTGKTWHQDLALVWNLFIIKTYDYDTKVPCCKEGEIVLNPKLRPRIDTPSNGDCKLCAQTASGAVGSAWSGGSISAQSRAAVPSDQILPLPFRPFGLPPVKLSSSPTTITPQCNSLVNSTMFHVLHFDSVVTRINSCTAQTIAAIQVSSNPLQVGVTPDGQWAIVTHYNNAISFIDTATNTVKKVIQTGGDVFPSGLAISPDGSFALVTSYIDFSPALLVIDLPTQSIIRTIPLARTFPQSVFLSPDATLAWVTYPFGSVVDVVDVMTGIVNYSLSVGEPIDVVFNPTGTVAYISNFAAGSVLAVDTTTYSIIKQIATGPGASDLLLAPTGGLLQVNNFYDNSFSIVDTSSLTVLQTTPVGGPPIGITPLPVQ